MAKTINLIPEDLLLIQKYFAGKMMDEGFLLKVKALAQKRFSGNPDKMRQYIEGMQSIASRIQVISQVRINPESRLANDVLLQRLVAKINAEGHLRFTQALLDNVFPKGPKPVKRSFKKPLKPTSVASKKPRRPK